MIFVDSSAWFAAVNSRDRHHARATEVLATHAQFATTDLIIVETWLLINSHINFATAERFLTGVRGGDCDFVSVTDDDWQHASLIGTRFPDQTFSLVDRTSFAVMERMGITQVASFDDDFVIYRYGHDRGQDRRRAFQVLR